MEPVEFRRRLHAHPELSFKEHDTAAFIEQQLDELGTPCPSRSGTTASGDR